MSLTTGFLTTRVFDRAAELALRVSRKVNASQ